jgi:nucleotide-binding universal stress UspA family protein
MVACRPSDHDELMSTTSLRDHQPVPVDPLVVGPVIVGFDGSPAAARALDQAAKALTPDGQLLVVTVEPQVQSRGLLSESLLEPGVSAKVLLDFARDRLGAAAPSLQLETIARTGDPGHALVKLARERDARLIALGGRGADYEARVLLGSVAAHVAEHAPCDVLVVR